MNKNENSILLCDLKAVGDALLDETTIENRQAHLKTLRKRPFRSLAHVDAAPDPLLRDMDQNYPHFHEVTSFLREQLSLCGVAGPQGVITLPPLLIAGPPGTGKTSYLTEICTRIGLEQKVLAGAQVSAAFVLSGSAPPWKDCAPGAVFNCLNQSKSANVMFCVDELDKMHGDDRHPPDGVLLTLLERHTAQQFTDEFIQIPIRADKLNWAATANDLSQISAPILDRFTVFQVEPPVHINNSAMAQSVYDRLLKENPQWGAAFAPQLPPHIASTLCTETPRALKQKLTAACGKAAYEANGLRPIHIEAHHIIDHGALYHAEQPKYLH